MRRFEVDLESNRIRNCDIVEVGVTFDVAFIVVGDDGGGSLQGREQYRRSGAAPSSSMTLANEKCRTRSSQLRMSFVKDPIGFYD